MVRFEVEGDASMFQIWNPQDNLATETIKHQKLSSMPHQVYFVYYNIKESNAISHRGGRSYLSRTTPSIPPLGTAELSMLRLFLSPDVLGGGDAKYLEEPNESKGDGIGNCVLIIVLACRIFNNRR
jgi:hypothetical protein